MNKVSVLVLISTGVFATVTSACSISLPVHDAAPSVATQQAFVRDLVNAVTVRLNPVKRPLYLHPMPKHEWLHDGVVRELRSRGFEVKTRLEGALALNGVVAQLGSGTLHVNLTIEPDIYIDRLYRFEPVMASAVRRAPKNSASVTSRPGEVYSDVKSSNFAREFVPRKSVKSADPINLPTLAHLEPIQARNIGTRTLCEISEFQPGSLKQNLARILESCGWRQASWPADPANSDHELDWVVAQTRPLSMQSLEALVTALERTFKLKVDLDPTTKTARFELRD